MVLLELNLAHLFARNSEQSLQVEGLTVRLCCGAVLGLEYAQFESQVPWLVMGIRIVPDHFVDCRLLHEEGHVDFLEVAVVKLFPLKNPVSYFFALAPRQSNGRELLNAKADACLPRSKANEDQGVLLAHGEVLRQSLSRIDQHCDRVARDVRRVHLAHGYCLLELVSVHEVQLKNSAVVRIEFQHVYSLVLF